jgi:hypothetical protein
MGTDEYVGVANSDVSWKLPRRNFILRNAMLQHRPMQQEKGTTNTFHNFAEADSYE